MSALAVALFALTALGALTLLAVTIALLVKAAGLSAERELLALRRPSDEELARFPKVSVVVPVRNEARNVEPALRSLLAYDYPHLEVLLVDDASTDDTVAIVQRLLSELDPEGKRARLLDLSTIAGEGGPERSAFKSGKAYVLSQAARAATGEWLLFADADVRHHPDGLWRSLAFIRDHDLRAYSASGVYPNPGFWGEILEGTLYVVVFFAIPLRAVNDPASRHLGWANGQFIMVERATYERLGGHAALAGFAQDDLAMGRLFKEWQVPYRFLPGAQLYTCVNYVDLDEAHRGWARLIAAGTPWLNRGRPFFLAVLAALLLTAVLPAVTAALAWSGLLPDVAPLAHLGVPVTLRGLSLGLVIGAIVFQALNRASMKVPLWRSVLAPVGALLCCRTLLLGYRNRFSAGAIELRGRTLTTDDPQALTDQVARAREANG